MNDFKSVMYFKIFYKNITFFFSLYFICQILSTDICTAKNTERPPFFTAGPQIGMIVHTATDTHTKKEYILFVFEQKKNLYKDIKYSFKRKIGTCFESNHSVCQSYILFKMGSFFFIPIYFGETAMWIFFPAIILAAWAGYFYGKRKGKKIAATREPPIYVPPVVLTKRGKFEDLAEDEKPFMQKYDMATVLFADIEGFSEITDSLEPETLLDELNSFFFYFDTIIDRYHIEKIKTMGDAYMCAGGIPQKNHTNPVDVTLVALDVQNHLKQLSKQNPNVWSVRIGIHTGQVVAGMLGHKKLSFDIWGHTVNVAARLESSCKAGKINISGTTYEKIKRYFDCEYQGVLPGTDDSLYYVVGLKSKFVEKDADGQTVPNHAFFVQMQLLRLGDLVEYVESMMADVASNLFFHNFKHALDVYEQVELLAHSENIEEEDSLLLKTAALLHDIGYSISYDNVRTLSEDMAREALLLFHYTSQQIDKVCRLMDASHYESTPNGILEEIMHDAHQMYFGRADYITRTMGLFREQKEYCIPVDKTEWLQNQLIRLANHQFHTRAAKKLVKVPAEQQIATAEELFANDPLSFGSNDNFS